VSLRAQSSHQFRSSVVGEQRNRRQWGPVADRIDAATGSPADRCGAAGRPRQLSLGRATGATLVRMLGPTSAGNASHISSATPGYRRRAMAARLIGRDVCGDDSAGRCSRLEPAGDLRTIFQCAFPCTIRFARSACASLLPRSADRRSQRVAASGSCIALLPVR
jgi:hypothetical protein